MLVPFSHCANFMCNDDDAVDGYVHWNNFGMVVAVAVHGPDDSLPSTHHQTNWAVQVVHPARNRLFVGRSYWKE